MAIGAAINIAFCIWFYFVMRGARLYVTDKLAFSSALPVYSQPMPQGKCRRDQGFMAKFRQREPGLRSTTRIRSTAGRGLPASAERRQRVSVSTSRRSVSHGAGRRQQHGRGFQSTVSDQLIILPLFVFQNRVFRNSCTFTMNESNVLIM